MSDIVMCPVCLKISRTSYIKKSYDKTCYCPDVECDNNYRNGFRLGMEKPDLLMVECIRKLRAKGYWAKLSIVSTYSGLFYTPEKRTTVEFFDENAKPITAPVGFAWEGNVLRSKNEENVRHTNYLNLLDWIDGLENNSNDCSGISESVHKYYKRDFRRAGGSNDRS